MNLRLCRTFAFAAGLAISALSATASRILTDETGRTVTLPDHPHRIVCLAPSVVDTVYALGAGADVVGITNYTRYPKDALTKPSVGDPMTPSVEAIVALHPDLVLGFEAAGLTGTTAGLTRLGVPVYLVDSHGLAGILHSIVSTGEALNRPAEAAALTNRLTARIAAVKARVHDLQRPSVLVPIWYDPIITIGKGAFMTELIEAAGARSVTDDLEQEWPQVSLEAVIARAPEALVLVRDGKITLELLAGRPGWSDLPAVKARRVYLVDDRVQLPSPVAIDALEELAREFHP